MTRLRAVLRGASVVLLASIPWTAFAEIDLLLESTSDVRSRIAPAAEVETFRFDAAAGATVTLQLTTSRKAPLDFAVTLRDPAGNVVPLAGAAGLVDAPGKFLLPRFALSSAGVHSVEVGANAAGEYRLKLAVGGGSGRALRLDLRPARLGRPQGRGETAVSARLGAAGGTLTVHGKGDLLADASVTLPTGAIGADTLVSIVSATPPRLPDPTQQRAVGRPLALSPAGLDAAQPATVTLPFLPGEVPSDLDAATELRVLRVDAAGKAETIVPSSVATRTVAFTTDRFGTFVVFSRRGAPQMAGKSYFEVGLELTYDANAQGDSRLRAAVGSRALSTFAGDGTFQRTVRRFGVSWTYDNAGVALITSAPLTEQSHAMTWELSPDGRDVELSSAGTVQQAYSAADDASALVGDAAAARAATPSVRYAVALRRPEELPTAEEVAGTYVAGGVQIGAAPTGFGPAAVVVAREFGTVTLKANGTWKGTGKGLGLSAVGDTVRKIPARYRVKGTWSIVPADTGTEFAGSLLLTSGDSVSRLYFDADTQRLLSVGNPYPNSPRPLLTMVVAVRRAKGLRSAALTGVYGGTEIGFAASSYVVPATRVSDLDATLADRSFDLDGATACTISAQSKKTLHRDATVAGGVGIGTSTSPAPVTGFRYRVTGAGKLRLTGPGIAPYLGAVSPDGGFAFLVGTGKDPAQPNGIALVVRCTPRE